MFKTFVLALRIDPIRIASYCIAERRINSCQFLLVRISSLYIRIDSLSIRTGIRRLSAATQYVAIRCATIVLSYWIAHVRIGSCKFLLVPIVFSSHHSAIVMILHHHRTASIRERCHSHWFVLLFATVGRGLYNGVVDVLYSLVPFDRRCFYHYQLYSMILM